MSLAPTAFTPSLQHYVNRHGFREPDVLMRLREEASELEQSEWQVSPEEGQLLALLIEIAQARRVVELGTFVGYGTLWLAKALRSGGTVVTCDIDERFPRIGIPYWDEAGVADRIDLRIAPAADTLEHLIADEDSEPVDFVFIDADKQSYPDYYELALQLLSPGGIVAIDNVFWHGAVADAGDNSSATEAIRAVNEKVHADPRVTASMIPIGDGLTIARKVAM